MDKTKVRQLEVAYEMALHEIRTIVGSRLNKEEFCFEAEVKYIKKADYTSFVKVSGIDGFEMQIKISHDLADQLRLNHTYLFTGNFEIGSRAIFGALQFKAHSILPIGGSFILMQQQASTQEIIEGQLLNKYKDDFSSFLGRAHCKVGLVTSPFSKAIGDVKAVLMKRSGIEIELFEVKLNNVESIVNGIYAACESLCDVIMIVRGGGKESDFGVFNSVEVVQAINASEAPVITGLGHTDDYTLADQAADRRETTPTRAAQYLVDKLGHARDYGYDSLKDTSYQNASVFKENKAAYQYKPYSSPHSNNRKDKKPNIVVVIAIVVILMCFYYFITK